MKRNDIFVSVILISDAYSLNVAKRIKDTTNILKANYSNYEVVVIDNGMSKKELTETRKILPKVPCIRIVRLSKITDIDNAIFAGVESVIGDYICILYNNDPVDKITSFIKENLKTDIVFGVADNLKRKNSIERLGVRFFYWYNRKYLGIVIPNGSTNFICINRNVANALTRSGRNIRHFRHLSKIIGFESVNFNYSLPNNDTSYSQVSGGKLFLKALDILFSYSSHPLRFLSYVGLTASSINVFYALYVVVVNVTRDNIEKGWTTLSLQLSLMFLLLFLIMTVISEYLGKILIESRNEQPYHIMNELSSTISLADETRRNVTK